MSHGTKCLLIIFSNCPEVRKTLQESNNLDETSILGIDEDSYLEYENLKEFHDWILSLKPKEVKDKRISKQDLL